MDLVSATAQWLADPVHWQGPNGIPARLEEHVAISALSLLLSALVAMPLGLWIGHTGRMSWLVVSSANAWRALPSFAVIGLLVPFTTAIDPSLGFTLYPTLVAMIVLAGPPILVNSYEGIAGVDRDLVEAARGMGMRERQILLWPRGADRPAGARYRDPVRGRSGDRHRNARCGLRIWWTGALHHPGQRTTRTTASCSEAWFSWRRWPWPR